VNDIPRGKYKGRRVGTIPKDESEHFMQCPLCGGWFGTWGKYSSIRVRYPIRPEMRCNSLSVIEPSFPPVTLGHIRRHGCRDLLVYCASIHCNHSAEIKSEHCARGWSARGRRRCAGIGGRIPISCRRALRALEVLESDLGGHSRRG
jgi:hypothetical protein